MRAEAATRCARYVGALASPCPVTHFSNDRSRNFRGTGAWPARVSRYKRNTPSGTQSLRGTGPQMPGNDPSVAMSTGAVTSPDVPSTSDARERHAHITVNIANRSRRWISPASPAAASIVSGSVHAARRNPGCFLAFGGLPNRSADAVPERRLPTRFETIALQC
jgi:hypothetical protein